jgi:tRNA-uridine 2-sulfurtransferase
VCDRLGIELHVLQCDDLFEQKVLRPAWQDYASGRTPSPCINCNHHLKFGFLLEWAEAHDCRFVASGHYARLIPGERGRPVQLHRGVDLKKDQSYFLFSLSPSQRERLLFPLGELGKPAVRELARELNLTNADRDDSQDACFTFRGESFSESLRHRFGAESRSGAVVGRGGTFLGEHEGIHRYTIGQRRGLGFALGKPAYVSRIDSERAEVELTSQPDDLYSSRLWADRFNWWDECEPRAPLACMAKIRSGHQAAPAVVELSTGDQVRIHFETPQRAVTPGQAVVLYISDQVIGGGWITRADSADK